MSDSEDYPPDFDLPLNKQQIIENFAFTPEKVVGRGSFGIVYFVTSPQFQQPLALKIVLQDRRYKNRELQLLQKMCHPNVTVLKKHFLQKASTNPDDFLLYIVMDYFPETASSLNKQYSRLKQHIPLIFVKLITYQLARSLAYLHFQKIAHRDVKPANILFDPGSLKTQLCDFGSAKELSDEQNVSYICSRYYRAPELVLGSVFYSVKVDVWSFGCVLAELLLGQPLFPGESSVDQFVEMVKILGSPSNDEFTAMNGSLEKIRFKEVKKYGLSKIFRQKCFTEAVDLLEKCLQYDPSKRIEAKEILLHPFYDLLRKIGKQLPGGESVPELFNFTPEEQQAFGENLPLYMKQGEVLMDDMMKTDENHNKKLENVKRINIDTIMCGQQTCRNTLCNVQGNFCAIYTKDQQLMCLDQCQNCRNVIEPQDGRKIAMNMETIDNSQYKYYCPLLEDKTVFQKNMILDFLMLLLTLLTIIINIALYLKKKKIKNVQQKDLLIVD